MPTDAASSDRRESDDYWAPLPAASQRPPLDEQSVEAYTPRHRARTAWIAGWCVAVYAMYTTVIGHDSYLPIYLAQKYLTVFMIALAVQRLLYAGRYVESLQAIGQNIVMYGGSLAFGFWLAMHAPAIGERNYCSARLMKSAPPPSVFRCTEAPMMFAGFVAGYWIIGWLLQWIERHQSDDS
jgi:hypothetical protein